MKLSTSSLFFIPLLLAAGIASFAQPTLPTPSTIAITKNQTTGNLTTGANLGTQDVVINGTGSITVTGAGNNTATILTLRDTDASHLLSVVAGSNLTANRTLTLTTGDASRTLALSANVTLDQDVSTTASPTFNELTTSSVVAKASAVGVYTSAPLYKFHVIGNYMALGSGVANGNDQLRFGINTGIGGIQVTQYAASNATALQLQPDGGTVSIGSGTGIAKILSAVAALDFPSTAAGAVADLTVTVTGATTTSTVQLGAPNGSVTATATYWAWVSAADTVTVRFSPKGTEDPASGSFRVTVTNF